MTDSWTAYGLLLAQVWEGSQESVMVVRDMLGHDQGQLLLGADTKGKRHVLAQIPEDYAYVPLKGAAIELTEWRHPQSQERFLDLVCHSEPLGQVFSLLADDVVERIQREQYRPHLAILAALDDWKRLLRPARELSEEAARGLYGELVLLKRLAERNPVYAFEAWTGPSGNVHDFTTARGDLEVKTSAREGREVEISSLRQLDQMGGGPLVLVRVHVASSPQGQSLGDMVEDLVTIGCLRAVLVEHLEAAGFLVGVDQDNHRFVALEHPSAWLVDDRFPGLRSDDLPPERGTAITRISYTLDLLGAPGELTAERLDEFMDGMMES